MKPITVIDTPAGPSAVGDLHWLEVAKARGLSQVTCVYTNADETHARLTEIEEILIHAGLPVLDKAALVAEWVKTWGRANNSGHVVQELTVGRPYGGIAQAARVLCVPGKTEDGRRKFIERMMKIDGISSEAKDEARRLGLENNQSALLAIANETSEEQVAKVHERAARKRGPRRKQAITPQTITLDKSDANDEVISEAILPSVPLGGPYLPTISSPPTTTKEDGADPHGDAPAQKPMEARDQAAYDNLIAAWTATSSAGRQRFIIEFVETY